MSESVTGVLVIDEAWHLVHRRRAPSAGEIAPPATGAGEIAPPVPGPVDWPRNTMVEGSPRLGEILSVLGRFGKDGRSRTVPAGPVLKP